MLAQVVIAHFGSIQKTADALEISREAVYAWGEYVPEAIAFRLHVETNGALVADVALYKRIRQDRKRRAARNRGG